MAPQQRVPGELHRRVDGDDGVAGDAQQQVPFARVERGEHLGGHRVGDDGVGGTEPLGRGHRVRSSADRPRGEHHRATPALRALADDGDDPRVGGARVLGDQHRRLLLVETQQLSAQDRQVTAQLRRQPRDAEVPARQQQHPHPVGVVVDQLVEHLDRRRGQQVGVVEHQQPGRHAGRLVVRRRDQLEQHLGAEVGAAPGPTAPRRGVRSRSQPLAPSDLPAPIGPTSMVSELSVPRSSRSQRRGRGT